MISYNNVRHFSFEKSLAEEKQINISVCEFRKKKNKIEDVSTLLVSGRKNGTEVQRVRNTRGVMSVHAYSTEQNRTALHGVIKQYKNILIMLRMQC